MESILWIRAGRQDDRQGLSDKEGAFSEYPSRGSCDIRSAVPGFLVAGIATISALQSLGPQTASCVQHAVSSEKRAQILNNGIRRPASSRSFTRRTKIM